MAGHSLESNQTQRPRISAIAALATNGVIGNNNKLPWHLPADLQHFKSITSGHPIIMGRKTFASIGRALPNRSNIILTRDRHFTAENCSIVHTFDEALIKAATLDSEEFFVIGGADIYQQFMPRFDRLYLTLVESDAEGDAYFPDIDWPAWKEVERIRHQRDEKNQFDYSFIVLERKSNKTAI